MLNSTYYLFIFVIDDLFSSLENLDIHELSSKASCADCRLF
jgi:hypothetical protein